MRPFNLFALLSAAAIACAVLIVSSCGKSNTPKPTNPITKTKTLEQMLDSGKWKVYDVTLSLSSGGTSTVNGKGTFSFSANGSNPFPLSGLAFTADGKGDMKGTIVMDGYPNGGAYELYGGALMVLAPIGASGTLAVGVTVSSTKLTLDCTNNHCWYTAAGVTLECTGFVYNLTR